MLSLLQLYILSLDGDETRIGNDAFLIGGIFTFHISHFANNPGAKFDVCPERILYILQMCVCVYKTIIQPTQYSINWMKTLIEQFYNFS